MEKNCASTLNKKIDNSLFWGRKGSYPTGGAGNSNGGNRGSLTRHVCLTGLYLFYNYSSGVSKDQNFSVADKEGDMTLVKTQLQPKNQTRI